MSEYLNQYCPKCYSTLRHKPNIREGILTLLALGIANDEVVSIVEILVNEHKNEFIRGM